MAVREGAEVAVWGLRSSHHEWASNKAQNQTLLRLGSIPHSGDERGLLKCAGTESDVSRWEPVDDSVSRRLAFVLLPAVGKKYGALLKSWQRTTWAGGTNAVFWALRFLGRNLWYLMLPEWQWGHEIILIVIFSNFENTPSIVLLLKPPVQICWMWIEMMSSLIGLLPYHVEAPPYDFHPFLVWW